MKKNNSNKVKLGASDKIVRGFGYVVITIYALACIHWQLMRWSARAVVSGNPICSRSS